MGLGTKRAGDDDPGGRTGLGVGGSRKAEG